MSFGDIPFIRLQHANEKNRNGSTVAVRSDLAVDLQKWIAGRDRAERVFVVPAGLVRILDRDLVAAGIPKVDADGFVVHVHALRHSFGTHLSLAGVAPRVAQKAMRHSNISLTMGAYTDARLLDTAQAVECLPSLPTADLEGQNVSRMVAPLVAPDPVKTGQNRSIPDPIEGMKQGTQDNEKTPENTVFAGVFNDGRYLTRTNDPHDVNVVL